MDTDLVTRAQGGDQEAFADLVYAIADRFLAVSHRILSDIGLAEDATQQALLSVWQTFPSCATRPTSRPGRIGSSCAPATPRAGSPVVGRQT